MRKNGDFSGKMGNFAIFPAELRRRIQTFENGFIGLTRLEKARRERKNSGESPLGKIVIHVRGRMRSE